MVTQQQARDMHAAIEQFQEADSAQAKLDSDAKRAVTRTWWDSIKPAVPTTREEALAVFQFIELEIIDQETNFRNEVDPVQKEIFEFRVRLLRKKLIEANEKFKERKRNG